MNKAIIEALYIKDLIKAQEKFDAMIRAAEYTKQDRLAALERWQSKEPDPVSVREAARVLLGHTPKITAKPLAEMSEAMKIDAHPAILLRGFCAALRAIEDGKDDD